MKKKLGLLTLHGMGRQEQDYACDLFDRLRRMIGPRAKEVCFRSVYYQDLLGYNQADMLCRMRPYIDWKWFRNLIVNWLSDATSLKSNKERRESVYQCTQKRIMDDCVYNNVEDGSSVVIVASSLGCQVISNYIWDAQREDQMEEAPKFGIWRAGTVENVCRKQDDFRRLKSLRVLFTTGCNIPLFVSGHSEIKAIQKPNPCFKWKNYYDEDDVLGWPLRPLSDSYCCIVDDKPINSGGFLSGTPASHLRYWEDRDFLKPLVDQINALLPAPTSGSTARGPEE